MSNRREYEIAFVGLKAGIHEFNYRVDDKFFESYQEQDFRKADAQVKLKLEKNNGFMQLRFEIGGQAEVTCDRCNNDLPFQLFDEFTVTVKLTDDAEQANENEEDPDVFYISRGESHLDVKDWIYEFVNLSIPMQKTCTYENMDGPYCNQEVRELLSRMRPEEEKKNDVWKGLEKFKDLDTTQEP
ncbi:Uncharacterized metal-binding protein YceD, DUF177 family [Cnuella takakiae]|uniref:Uncharacterized metal-binding protein YceD, DUF177 family n=1 Tax=Cnuella takakiae TaxID=1302690 RepID=A0A1M5B7T8_9BACT|nr:DUF177 domain-containing protein [Cnuella takakiae]OLY93363.1 hypothetical protein BUE76_16855 [Cnuella takakiae]SHF38377.1 Uncharacterized metal-binding protein YceD, DUF177 family [Cnuella takakiae]